MDQDARATFDYKSFLYFASGATAYPTEPSLVVPPGSKFSQGASTWFIWEKINECRPMVRIVHFVHLVHIRPPWSHPLQEPRDTATLFVRHPLTKCRYSYIVRQELIFSGR